MNPGLQRETPVCKAPTHPSCSWLGLLLLFTALQWCSEWKLQRKNTKREASDQASVIDTFGVTPSPLHLCCLFQDQHEKMKLFWPENCQHQLFLFAVQMTTFLYRRQRWKSFDVAVVQKNKVRVSINHGRDLSLDAPGVVVRTLCPGVGLSIWWGSNDTLDVSSKNSTGQERENVSPVWRCHPSEGSWRNLSGHPLFFQKLWSKKKIMIYRKSHI